MAIPFTGDRPRYADLDGKPLSGGSIEFYDAGTTTLKNVYQSHVEDPSNLAQNPAPLDASGYVYNENGIWLTSGPYKIIIKDSNDVVQYTEDFIPGDGVVSSTIKSTAIISTVESLRTLDDGQFDVVYCLGHTTIGDNGGGWFYWDATETALDDNGYIVIRSPSPATGRFVRQFNDTDIYPEMWGGIPNDDSLTIATNVQNMIQVANSKGLHIIFNAGEYFLNGSVTFSNGGHSVEFRQGANIGSTGHVGNIGTIRFKAEDTKIDPNTRVVIPQEYTLIYESHAPAYLTWWGYDSYALNAAVFGVTRAQLRVNSSTTLSSTIVTPITVRDLFVEETGSLYITPVSPIVTINRFGSDSSSYCFRGIAYDKIVLPIDVTYQLEWFDLFDTSDNAKLSEWNSFTLYGPDTTFLVNGDHTFPVNGYAAHGSKTYVFQSGKVKFDDIVYMETIKFEGGTIDYNSSSQVATKIRLFDVRWFGAIADNTATSNLTANALALNTAIRFVTYNSIGSTKTYLTSNKSVIHTDAPIVYTGGSTLYARELSIRGEPTVVSATYITLTCNVVFDTVNIELETSNPGVRFATITGEVYITNSYFYRQGGLASFIECIGTNFTMHNSIVQGYTSGSGFTFKVNSTGTCKVTNCTFAISAFYCPSTKDIIYTNNNSTGIVSVNMTATHSGVMCNNTSESAMQIGGEGLNISNNICAVSLILKDIHNCVVDNNIIYIDAINDFPNIYIDNTGIVSGLWITNNKFINRTGLTPVVLSAIKTSATVSSFGHFAYIADNDAPGGIMPSTKIRGYVNLSYPPGATATSDTTTVDIEDLIILPYYETESLYAHTQLEYSDNMSDILTVRPNKGITNTTAGSKFQITVKYSSSSSGGNQGVFYEVITSKVGDLT